MQDTLEEEHNIYKLLSLTPREQLSEDTDIKSHNVILLLAQEDQKKLKCLAEVSLNLFRKNTENIFRSLQNIAKKVPYFLTRNHGDAHIHNFFYNNSPLTQKNQPLPSDSFYRIAMIDFATIFNTSEQTGDPAEDVGRILAALRNWSIIAQDKCNKEEKVALLKREFIEHYLNKIKKSNIIEPENREDFERMLKENAVVYELRYYRAIFNVKKHHELEKDKEIKRQFLKSWIEENAALEAFSKELDQQNYFTVKANDRSWEPVCTYKDPIVHWLPDWSNEFIESPTEDGKISYLTSLWQMLNDTGTVTLSSKATLAGMGGIGKTTLALAYGHEALANNAYHLIYWIYSGTEHSLLKSYRELLLKMNIVKDISTPINDLKELIEKNLPARSLLIYDNVPEFYDDISSPIFLKDMIPAHKNAHILMTSRRNEGWINPPLNLKVFNREDSVEYLLKITGLERTSDNEKIAGELAHELGDFPLALAHAAHYLKLVGGNEVLIEHFKEYLEEFNLDENRNPHTEPKPKITYENLIARTLRISEKYLRNHAIFEPAKELLAYCSYLDPDKIQEEIFIEYWPKNETKENIPEVIKTLNALSLIKKSQTDPVFSIHRLVQLVIREEEKKLQKNYEHQVPLLKIAHALNCIFKKIICESNQIKRKLLVYFPHIFQTLRHSVSITIPFQQIEDLQWLGKISFLFLFQKPPNSLKKKFEESGFFIFVNYFNPSDTPDWLIQFAEERHPKLQYILSLMYYYDDIFSITDNNCFLYWCKKSAKNGYKKAQSLLGRLYLTGYRDIAKNNIKARNWLTKAAVQGNRKTQFLLGCMYSQGIEVGQDDKEAVKWLRQATSKGKAKDFFILGLHYFSHCNIKAIKYFTKAAMQNHLHAQFILGLLYYYNNNGALASEWFTKAALQESVEAQGIIGAMYREGKIVCKDEGKYIYWMKKAADQGFVMAQHEVGTWYTEGYFEIIKDHREAIKWFQKAAEQGFVASQFNLGLMYYKGEGVEEDAKEAIKWFQKAAEQGNIRSQFYLGQIYLKGEGVENDAKEAIKWLRKAAEQGDILSQFELSQIYSGCNGGVEQDLKESIKWLGTAIYNGIVEVYVKPSISTTQLSISYVSCVSFQGVFTAFKWLTTPLEWIYENVQSYLVQRQQNVQNEKQEQNELKISTESMQSALIDINNIYGDMLTRKIAKSIYKMHNRKREDCWKEVTSFNPWTQLSSPVCETPHFSSTPPQTLFDTVTTSTTTTTTTMSICTSQSSSQSMSLQGQENVVSITVPSSTINNSLFQSSYILLNETSKIINNKDDLDNFVSDNKKLEPLTITDNTFPILSIQASNNSSLPSQSIDLQENRDHPIEYNHGLMYFVGNGVEQNYEMSFKYFLKAAKQGYKEAQFFLKMLYEDGLVKLQDDSEDFIWYNENYQKWI